jgi:hypothetical protein
MRSPPPAAPSMAGWTSPRSCRRTEPRTNGPRPSGRVGWRLRQLESAQLPRRGLRLRRQAQHPAHAGRPRLPRDRGAGPDACRRGAGAAPDGVFLSNGPGDPEPCDYAIAPSREILVSGVPTFGICLGHQIMALASGAKTFKMKFGHHGANHPVKDLDSGRVSHHEPEPRLRGRRATLPPTCGPPTSRCSTARCRAWPAPTARRSASRAIPRRARARTTSATCSTASSR